MKVKRYESPSAAAPAVDAAGRLTSSMVAYLAGVQDATGRVGAHVDALDGGATSADIIDKINELIAALEAARLLHPED